jgi:hypothetical protein
MKVETVMVNHSNQLYQQNKLLPLTSKNVAMISNELNLFEKVARLKRPIFLYPKGGLLHTGLTMFYMLILLQIVYPG